MPSASSSSALAQEERPSAYFVSSSAAIPISRRPNFERSRVFSVILIFQRWLVIRGFVRWRLATLHGKRVGFPAGSRWSAAGRFKKRPAGWRAVGSGTLRWWGACYPEKKARRLGFFSLFEKKKARGARLFP